MSARIGSPPPPRAHSTPLRWQPRPRRTPGTGSLHEEDSGAGTPTLLLLLLGLCFGWFAFSHAAPSVRVEWPAAKRLAPAISTALRQIIAVAAPPSGAQKTIPVPPRARPPPAKPMPSSSRRAVAKPATPTPTVAEVAPPCPRAVTDFPLPDNTGKLDYAARPVAPIDLCVTSQRKSRGAWDAVSPETVKVWFVTYGNEKLGQSPLRLCGEAHNMTFFAEERCFTRNDLPPLFVESNRGLLGQQRGRGFGVWRPFLLERVLREMAWGDVLMYLDPSFTFTKDPVEILNAALDGDGALSWRSKASENFAGGCKADAIAAVLPATFADPQSLSALHPKSMSPSAFLVLQKRPWTVALVQEWAWWTLWPGLVSDSKSLLPDAPTFKSHKFTDAMWSLLVAKYGVSTMGERFSGAVVKAVRPMAAPVAPVGEDGAAEGAA